MQTFIETIIYLLAVLGIILVSSSFFEMIKYTNILKSTYSMFNRANKKVEVTVKFFNVQKVEKKAVLDKLQKGDYDNIEEIVDSLKIEEVFDKK